MEEKNTQEPEISKVRLEEILEDTEQQIGPNSVSPVPEMKHKSIRWILISLLGIIGLWGTLLLLFFFFKMPELMDAPCSGDPSIYTQLLDAHAEKYKDLAQITFLAIVPVFSTLAGSYIRGRDDD